MSTERFFDIACGIIKKNPKTKVISHRLGVLMP